MAFNHTEYAHRTGRRSRPRGPLAMLNLFDELEAAIEQSQLVRRRHRGKKLRSRVRDMRIAEARLEAAMGPARQEAARNGKDPRRREQYGDDLKHRPARARYERLRLKKMIGDWK